jgi:hypothetical protein
VTVFGRALRRGGAYGRLADPAWEDPLDIGFARERGGRWNPPRAFGTLCLNRTVAMARAQIAHRLAGQPFDVEDLDASEQHDLVAVDVPEDDYLDCVTDAGLHAVGLPESYPKRADVVLSWNECRPIGIAARDGGRPGVACRSAVAAAPPGGEELAVFDVAMDGITMTGRRPFADWYYD